MKRATPNSLPKSKEWVATVVLQSNEQYSNEERLEALSHIVGVVSKETEGNGVIVFLGGWFNAYEEEAKSLYDWAEKSVRDYLSRNERNSVVCIGIDGRISQYARDQIGMAISKQGIEAIGRKFHPAPIENGHVELARDYQSMEEKKARFFDLDGRSYFLCACYDSFGIRQKVIPKCGVDIILDLVHGFYPKGKPGSGEVYFAKYGFAGASKSWDCLVFGAAVFFNRSIPERWPSGVYWNQGDKSVQKWRYTDNPLKPKVTFELSMNEGVASIRIYDLDVITKMLQASI